MLILLTQYHSQLGFFGTLGNLKIEFKTFFHTFRVPSEVFFVKTILRNRHLYDVDENNLRDGSLNNCLEKVSLWNELGRSIFVFDTMSYTSDMIFGCQSFNTDWDYRR